VHHAQQHQQLQQELLGRFQQKELRNGNAVNGDRSATGVLGRVDGSATTVTGRGDGNANMATLDYSQRNQEIIKQMLLSSSSSLSSTTASSSGGSSSEAAAVSQLNAKNRRYAAAASSSSAPTRPGDESRQNQDSSANKTVRKVYFNIYHQFLRHKLYAVFFLVVLLSFMHNFSQRL
jgi:hypothetical protein